MTHKNAQKCFYNVDKNANIVIESELSANVRRLALMNVSSRNWSPFYANGWHNRVGCHRQFYVRYQTHLFPPIELLFKMFLNNFEAIFVSGETNISFSFCGDPQRLSSVVEMDHPVVSQVKPENDGQNQ